MLVLSLVALEIPSAQAARRLAAPRDLQATAASATAIQLRWHRVREARSYRVIYSTVASMRRHHSVVFRHHRGTITGLRAGTSYYVRVAALRGIGKKASAGRYSRGRLRSTTAPHEAAASNRPGSVVAGSIPLLSTFPDATNTGVPSGLPLVAVPAQQRTGAGWAWSDTAGCINVTGAGATLSGLNVSGCIEVKADNVTVADSRITNSGQWWAIGARGVKNLVVHDSTISGGGRLLEVGIKDVTGSSTMTLVRNDISDWTTGIQMSAGWAQDNYVHDPKDDGSGYHLNGFTDNGGRDDGTTMTVVHNTILNSFGQADAVSLFEDFGAVNDVTVDNNLLAGGSYTLYPGGGVARYPSTNIVITNNRFSTRYLSQGGAFGPTAMFDSGGAGNVWRGNSWYDGSRANQAIPAP